MLSDSVSDDCCKSRMLLCRMADWWTLVPDKDKDVMSCERDEEFWSVQC